MMIQMDQDLCSIQEVRDLVQQSEQFFLSHSIVFLCSIQIYGILRINQSFRAAAFVLNGKKAVTGIFCA